MVSTKTKSFFKCQEKVTYSICLEEQTHLKYFYAFGILQICRSLKDKRKKINKNTYSYLKTLALLLHYKIKNKNN